MSRFAVALSIGPVGDFIAGGRRSRDLWYGSRLVSELTRQVAFRLREHPEIQVVFHVPLLDRLYQDAFFPEVTEDAASDEDAAEDATADQARAPIPPAEEHRRPTISNRIQCIVDAADAQVLGAALGAARDHAFAWLARQLSRMMETPWFRSLSCDPAAFAAQRDAIQRGDFLEIQAAYQLVAADSPSARAAALGQAIALLGAAKNTRAFPAATFSAAGRRKSSQDPGRDSVLIEGSNDVERARLQVQRWARGLRLEERLDAVALLRRHAVLRDTPRGRTQLPTLPFPPLHRVAAEPWLRGAAASSDRRALLDQVRGTLDGLWRSGGRVGRDALLLLSSPCQEPRAGQAAPDAAPVFPFDPTLLYDGGLAALEREIERVQRKAQAQDPVLLAARGALRRLRRPVAELHHACGVPSPYYALLTADGDGMGHLLQTAADPAALIQGLYRFADAAWRTIDQHGGCAFYVGGDELAAYLPVDQALPAALALAELYQGCVSAVGASLSVGVTIAHVKEDLRATRRAAHRALDRAKAERRQRTSHVSWLCIDEQPRGGAPRACVAETAVLHESIKGWVAALKEEGVSMKTAHDLRALKERLRDPDRADGGADGLVLAQALAAKKERRREEASGLGEAQARRFRALSSWQQVELLVHELLLAAHVQEVQAQRGVAGGGA